MDDTIIAYIAGFFDGEGNIYRGKTTRRVAMVQVDPSPLKLIREHFGGSLSIRPARKPHYKDQWCLTLTTKADIERFLTAVRPYLLVKAEQADRMIASCREVYSKPLATHCRNGHSLEGVPSGRWCPVCQKEYNRRYYQANREKLLARKKKRGRTDLLGSQPSLRGHALDDR